MSKNKFFATTATAALVASAIVPAAASAADLKDFDSVPSYAKEAVKFLADNDFVQGDNDGNFKPASTLMRAQAAEIIAKVLDLKADGTEDFSDVESKDWFYKAVVATSPEIFEGNGQGQFNPLQQLTRQEAAQIIVKAFDLKGSADLTNFADAKELTWAKASFETAVANDVIKGKDGKLAPTDNISNAEFAVMIKRAIDAAEAPVVEVPEVTSVSAIDATTMEVTIAGELTDEQIAALTFEFDPSLEVTKVERKAAEVQTFAATTSTTVVLTTEEQDADSTYNLVAVNGTELETAVEVQAPVAPVEFEVVSVSAVDNTKSFNVTLEEATEGLTAKDFEVEVTVDEETTTAKVVKVTANEDNTVYTVELENDLYLTKGSVSINGVEKEFDYSETAEETAISSIRSAIDNDQVLAALNAPVLSLVDVNEDLAANYLANKANFAKDRAEVQKNIVDYTNAKFAETVAEGVADVAEAVKAYDSAINATELKTSLIELDVAINALSASIEDEARFTEAVDSEDTDAAFKPVSYTGEEAQEKAVFEGKTAGLILADFLSNVNGSLELSDIQDAIDYLNELLSVDNDIEKAITAFEAATEEDLVEKSVAVIGEYYNGVDAVKAMVAGAGQEALETKLEGTYTAITAEIEGQLTNLNGLSVDNIADIKTAQETFDDVQPLVNALRSSDEKTEFVKTLTAVKEKIATASKGLLDTVNAKVAEPGDQNADLMAALRNAGITSPSKEEAGVFAKAATAGKVTFTSIKEVTEAFEDAELVAPVNAALDGVGSTETALNALEYSAFINLGSTLRPEVATNFYLNEVANETEFATTAEVKAAVDAAIASHKALLADINAATTITGMQDALQAVADVALQVYDKEDVNEVDPITGKVSSDDAENVLDALNELRNSKTPTQFKTITEAVSAMTPAE